MTIALRRESGMSYKVFFVEDEIVTREGIRDNVDWNANGFEFCGEAPDGEMALPLLQATQPDVLITDIKMPFMDGLQLSKIVRERMPWVKIIILSGHDEFEYAQEAIKLGVTEYLLKPVTVQDLHQCAAEGRCTAGSGKKEQENLQKLQDQVEENRAILQGKAFAQSWWWEQFPRPKRSRKASSLGLDLIARCYLVVILKIELGDRSEQFDYDEYQQVQQIVAGLVEKNPDVFLLKKDWEELVLMMKGNTPEYLEEERDLLLERIKREVNRTRYQLTIGSRHPKNTDRRYLPILCRGLVNIQNAADEKRQAPNQAVDKAELLKVDKSAVENYLEMRGQRGF